MRPLLIRPHQARIARHVGGEDRGEAADGGHVSAGEKLGLTNSTPKQPGGPSIAIRCPALRYPGRFRSVHTAGVTGFVLVRVSVRRRTRPGGHGRAPGERHNDEERGKPAVPAHWSLQSTWSSKTISHRQEREASGARLVDEGVERGIDPRAASAMIRPSRPPITSSRRPVCPAGMASTTRTRLQKLSLQRTHRWRRQS